MHRSIVILLILLTLLATTTPTPASRTYLPLIYRPPGPTVTPTATSTWTSTPTATLTPPPTPTQTFTPTATTTEAPTPTATATGTFTLTPTKTPTTTATPTATPTSTPTATPVPLPSGVNGVCNNYGVTQICAWVSNGTPYRGSTVTVYGRLLIAGVGQSGRLMTATWHYKTTTPTCTGTTGSAGTASCSRNIGQATLNYRVNVDIAIDGHQATTWFIPQ